MGVELQCSASRSALEHFRQLVSQGHNTKRAKIDTNTSTVSSSYMQWIVIAMGHPPHEITNNQQTLGAQEGEQSSKKYFPHSVDLSTEEIFVLKIFSKELLT